MPIESKNKISLAILRQLNPTACFPDEIANMDLHEFGAAIVKDFPPPSHDPRTERIEEILPQWTPDGLVQQWQKRQATAEEIEAYDLENPLPPNYQLFRDRLIDGNSPIAQAYRQALFYLFAPDGLPQLALGLATSLYSLQQRNDPSDFLAFWRVARQAGAISADTVTLTEALATECHLPDSFVSGLNASPS